MVINALWAYVFTMLFSCLAMAEERGNASLKLQTPGGAKMAPPFSLIDTGGNTRRLGDYRGKVVFIHFWATWCDSCKDEMPAINTLRERFKDKGFEVVSIAADSRTAVEPFVRKYGLKFPVLIDQYGSALRSYEVRAFPTSYIVDKAGKIKGIAIGPRDWASDGVNSLINDLLEEK